MRDVRKDIAEYRERFEVPESKEGRILFSDVKTIKEMSEGKEGNELLYDCIVNALYAGFMIGMRYGKRRK